MFAGCEKLFSWLGQKINTMIDAFGHDANNSGCDLWPWDDAAVHVPARILDSIQYSIFNQI